MSRIYKIEQDLPGFSRFGKIEQDFQDFQDFTGLGFWCAGAVVVGHGVLVHQHL